jgi:hypothetical protein
VRQFRRIGLPLIAMYLVPATLLAWLESFQRGLVDPYTTGGCVLLGMAFVAVARWPTWLRLAVAAIYAATATQILPYISFMETCMVSECLPL